MQTLNKDINDQAIQNQLNSITENNKLDFYKIIHVPNKRPSYVDTCRFKSDRSTLCKFRISAHSLAIEQGRYKNIPRPNRICSVCNTGQIEDEKHFFLYCPAYNTFRQDLNHKLKSSYKNLKSLSLSNIAFLLNNN